MTLTEEQRAALKRVIAYMNRMYGIASPYYGCTEDANILRAMIDSSGTVEPTGGFDLERARGLRDFLQDDCAEVGDVWGEMIAEIERLRPFEIAARDLDSDLTKIAGERDDQAARIKELEAELAEMHNCALEVAGFLAEKENLEAALVEERAGGCMKTINVSEEVYDYLKGMVDDEHVSNSDDSEERNTNGETVAHRPSFSEVISHLIEDREAEPLSWQITDERKATLSASLKVLERLKKNNTDTDHSYLDRGITVLRAMLEESQ